MTRNYSALVFLAFLVCCDVCQGVQPIELISWRWRCQVDDCVKVQVEDENKHDPTLLSLDGCKSVCGLHGSIWPQPETSNLAKTLTDIHIHPSNSFQLAQGPEDVERFVRKAWQTFLTYLPTEASNSTKGLILKVVFRVERDSLKLDLDTDETYSLTVESAADNVHVRISSPTVFGARHALETLSHLISNDRKALQIVSKATITDGPKFKFRGFLLDTGRSYFSVKSIMRILDGMSYDKLNVFHWHMNEQMSFPFVSESVPQLTKYGAYSDKELYYPSDVAAVVRHAHQLGIMVLPEFDAPAHASAGWQWGPSEGKGKLIVCDGKEWANETVQLAASPNSGQLNPVNPHVYEVLEKVFGDVLKAFGTPEQPVSMFHMGGDEVSFPCWETDPDIAKWLQEHGFPTDTELGKEGYLQLWSLFQEKARQRLLKAHGGEGFKHDIIMWTSELAKPENIEKYLPKDKYVIQIWSKGDDPWISELLSKQYRVIFSNTDAWYLDCGFGAWIYNGNGPENNWCSPFKGWKTVYMNSPRNIAVQLGILWTKDVQEQVWGGEAALWSEQVDENGAEPRIWPRLSAFSERLWSDPATSWQDAERRILDQRQRLVGRGIRADVVQPTFCRQNEGWCFKPKRPLSEMYPYGQPIQFSNENGQQIGLDNQQAPRDDSIAHNQFGMPEEDQPGQQHHPHRVPKARNSNAFFTLTCLVSLLFLVLVLWANRRIVLGCVMKVIRVYREKITNHIA